MELELIPDGTPVVKIGKRNTGIPGLVFGRWRTPVRETQTSAADVDVAPAASTQEGPCPAAPQDKQGL